MNKTISLIGMCAVMIATAGCSSTNFTESKKAEDVGVVDFTGKKVAALVVHPDASVRMQAEDALAADLTKRGMTGVAAHTFIGDDILRDKEKAKAAIKDSGAEGVVVLRLVGVEETTQYVDPFEDNYSHYGSMMSYYDYGWNTVYAGGYYDTYKTYIIETLCYRVADEKLLWRGVSETFAPNSIKSLSASLVKEAGKVMKKQGLVKPKK